MNREIKFRGRDTLGDWHKGMLSADCRHIIRTHRSADGTVRECYQEVEADTIGQFTGLRDINGREVYEGDIVKSELPPCTPSGNPTPILGVVEWWGEKAEFVVDCTSAGSCRYGMNFAVKGEVVGNIHESRPFE